MPRRFRFAAVSALIVVAATGLAACSDDKPDAASLLKDTFGPDHSVKSGKLDVKLVLDAKGLESIKGPVSLAVEGPFESQGEGKVPKVDLGLKIGGSGAAFTAGAITDGEAGWLEVQGTPFAVDATTFAQFKRQYEESAKDSGDGEGQTLKSLGIDPLRWLKNPKIAGTEDSGDAETYRVSAGIDVAAFLDDVNQLLSRAGNLGSGAAGVPEELSEAQRLAIAASVESAVLDVWVGKDDKTLRRLKIDIGIDVPKAIRKRAGGLSTGTLTFDLAIDDLNQPQTITPPENARPLSELQELIAGGGAGGGSSDATPDAAPTTTTPTAPPAETGTGGSEYLDCVNRAGSDVRELQECAELAGG
jgi:hypothetical protein